MRVTVRFDEIKRSRTVREKCKRCGKKFQRTFTASQTENPYNRNEAGFVKSRIEIATECSEKTFAQAKEFKKYPLCSKCAEAH